MRKFREVWTAIQKLDHLQTQALLLRYCASFCKVVHLFRTVPPALLSAELSQFPRIPHRDGKHHRADVGLYMGVHGPGVRKVVLGFVRRDYTRLVVTWQVFVAQLGG